MIKTLTAQFSSQAHSPVSSQNTATILESKKSNPTRPGPTAAGNSPKPMQTEFESKSSTASPGTEITLPGEQPLLLSNPNKKGNSVGEMTGQTQEFAASLPITPKASIKIAQLHLQAYVNANASIKTVVYDDDDEDDENTPTTNKDVAINKSRIEPFVISNIKAIDFKGDPYSPMLAAIEQAFIEDRISQKYLSTTFSKINVGDNDLSQVESRINQQLTSAQNLIDQLFLVFDLLKVTNMSMDVAQGNESISSIAMKTANALCEPEQLLVKNRLSTDPKSFLNNFGYHLTAQNLDTKSRTALVTQVLQVAAQSLGRGYTPAILNDAVVNIPKGQMQVAQNLFKKDTRTEKYPVSLKLLSARNSPATSFAFGFGSPGVMYNTHQFYKNINVQPHRRALMLSTMLANEFAVSAGLGRLSGTPLGNRFGSDSSNFIASFLGTAGISNASKETANINSLADSLVVATDGSASAHKKQRVVLLDGDNVQGTQAMQNAFSSFLKSIARSPQNNKAKRFDDALIAANSSFDDGLQFYKKLHLRDKEPTLLTPRGLYTRLLHELSKSLEQCSAPKGLGDSTAIMELTVLRDLAIQSRGFHSPGSHTTIIKQFFLGMIAHKSMLSLLESDRSQPGTNAQAEKKSPPTSTTVTIKKGNAKIGETFTVDTTQNETSSPATKNVEFPDDMIRFSPTDSYAAGLIWVPNNPLVYSHFDKLASVAPFFQTAAEQTKDFGVFSSTLSNLLIGIQSSNISLMSRLANVFIELHDEARTAAKTENDTSTWLEPGRLTRNSQLDGTLAISMLFETMLDLVSIFVDSEIRKGPAKFRLKAVVPVGPNSTNDKSRKAINVLVTASKNNNFSNAISTAGLIPDLDNISKNEPLTVSNYQQPLSYKSFEDIFVDLAKERDIPLAAMTGASAMLQHTFQQTRNISNLAAELRGEKEQSQLSAALSEFSKTFMGKTFLLSVTDYSLDISQDRLNIFKNGMAESSKKVPKITLGEVFCMKKLFKEISSLPTDNLVFGVFGLPGDFLSGNLLPKYRLSTGFESSPAETVLALNVLQDGVLDEIDYQPLTREFSVLRLIDENSFSPFVKSKPTTMDDIVSRVLLTSGENGKQFINKYAVPSRARVLLKNEVYSFLLKKAFSILSVSDTSEKNLVKFDFSRRSPGSSSLAKTVAKTLGYDEKIFEDVFLNQESDVTQLSEGALLANMTSKVKKTPTGQKIKPQLLNLGDAELFYDIFGSIYFYDGIINEYVFAPSYFDKTIGVLFYADEFATLSTDPEIKVKGGKTIDANDKMKLSLAGSDASQSTVSVMTYSVAHADPTPPMVLK